MHYHAEVWVPTLENLQEQIEEILAPYSEHGNNEEAFFDWWQIGGRWTGLHDSSYDPEKDRENYEDCRMCGGTGLRNDELGQAHRLKDPTYTCNGCTRWDNETQKAVPHHFGPGKALKWPTSWVAKGSWCKVEALADDIKPFTLVVGNGIFHDEHSVGAKEKLTELGITTGYLVTVDYHS